MPIARPVKMPGPAPGSSTSRSSARRPAPRLRAEASRRGSSASTPCTVLSRIGNSAPVKVMKIIEASDEGNIRIARGIQATAGIGRSTSSGGSSKASAQAERPIARPRAMPSAAASR